MNQRSWSVCVLLLVFCSCASALALAQSPAPAPSGVFMPSVVTVPPDAQARPGFNADRATEAYLAEIPPQAKARSDSYFEGGYWLILWDFLYAVVVALLLLNLRWSAAFRNIAERIARFKPLQTFIYWGLYSIVGFVLSLPIAIYEGYIREHKYGLATQTFGPWMGDQLKGLLLSVVLGGLVVTALFGIVRRLRTTWWLWGAVVTFIFFTIGIMIAPVYIAPLFNTYKRLDDPKITTPILSLARANGIPAKDVFKVDASRQSTRMSANVSGMGNTMRITLNDNLLNRASSEEVQAVMGHEMGHYVLNHIYKMLLFFGVIIFLFFALLRWAINWSLARWGARWQIRDVGDPAVVPVVVLIASIFFFVLTPVNNTFIRTQEHEADIFGINASRQPDGFAQGAIHLGEYRKMSPGPLEEWLFFDHPSGRNRIHDAMQWKAENLSLMESNGK